MLSAIEFIGPCRFDRWADESDDLQWLEDRDLEVGDPIAKGHPRAWIQIAAVSKEQTKNTMLLFPGLFSKECMANHGMNKASIGKEVVYAYHGQRQIQAVTSSPRALEGGRPTFIIRNEALALDTPIPTPSGWTTMGALADGDVIFGDDGKPTVVTKAHPAQEGRRCFKVTFGEGDSVVASDGHWWQARVANNRNCTMARRTTLEMFEAGHEFWLPDLAALETGPDVDLPVDPYVLGLWLGDGHSKSAQIACDARDIDEVAAEMTRLGVRKVAKTGERGLHLTLADTTRCGRQAGYIGRSIQGRLRLMGLLGNKHVPDVYLRASRSQRLALLQGLMDSDGSIRPNGAARFCNANPRLIEAARELLLSLGYQCQRATWQTRDAEQWPDRAHWQPMGFISFIAYDEASPFRLSRKAKHVRSGPMPAKSRKIAKIEEIESVPVRCISVSSDGKVAERGSGSEDEAIERYYSGSESRQFLAGTGMHPTLQTHHWLANNDGHAMAEVIDRNATKSKDGAARALSITNAYEPSEESVAQQQREAWENEQAGLSVDTGVLYDSLEAPEDTPLLPKTLPGDPPPTPEQIKAHIGAVIEAVRGDAVWLNVDRIVASVLDKKIAPSLSRRFFFNQVVSSEDSWAEAAAIEAAVDPYVAELRAAPGGSVLKVGWIVPPADPVVMFFDGSKSDDATGLVLATLKDDYVFTGGVWQRPAGLSTEMARKWRVPRHEVDARVEELFERFNVVAFWADPSHTKDDDGERYWDALIDDWHLRYRDKLLKECWPVKSGASGHSIMWDMASPQRAAQFTAGAERFVTELHRRDDVGEFKPAFRIDGHPALKKHMKNARRYPTGDGVSLWKGHRESPDKIDLAVCAVGARMLRRVVLNTVPDEPEDKPGEVWG